MKNAKIKYTNQRVEILNFLKDNTTHPTVDKIYEGVRKKLTQIGKATVYQNLKFLTDKGLIQEVDVKGVLRFESDHISHHHIICRRCGKIIDFKSEELTNCSLNIVKKLKDFDTDATSTNFYGICKECKSGK